MKDKSEITWSKAQQIAKEQEAQKVQDKKDHEKNVDEAHEDLWESMGSESFRTSDFDDICSGYGIDPDDLLDRLI